MRCGASSRTPRGGKHWKEEKFGQEFTSTELGGECESFDSGRGCEIGKVIKVFFMEISGHILYLSSADQIEEISLRKSWWSTPVNREDGAATLSLH